MYGVIYLHLLMLLPAVHLCDDLQKYCYDHSICSKGSLCATDWH